MDDYGELVLECFDDAEREEAREVLAAVAPEGHIHDLMMACAKMAAATNEPLVSVAQDITGLIEEQDERMDL